MGSFKFNTTTAYEYKGEWVDARQASPATNREIEMEIKTLVDSCMENVTNLIKAKRVQLDKLAQALVEKETLYFADIAAILEPERSKDDIQREIDLLGTRKLVGKPPVIDLDNFGGWALPGVGGSGATQPGGSNNNKTPKPTDIRFDRNEDDQWNQSQD